MFCCLRYILHEYDPVRERGERGRRDRTPVIFDRFSVCLREWRENLKQRGQRRKSCPWSSFPKYIINCGGALTNLCMEHRKVINHNFLKKKKIQYMLLNIKLMIQPRTTCDQGPQFENRSSFSKYINDEQQITSVF